MAFSTGFVYTPSAPLFPSHLRRGSNACTAEYRKIKRPFPPPQHGVSPHAPCQRLASPVGSRQATGPRRRARTGRVAGDGQPALLGLLGGTAANFWGAALRA